MKKFIFTLALAAVLFGCEKQKLQKQFEDDCKKLTENYWVSTNKMEKAPLCNEILMLKNINNVDYCIKGEFGQGIINDEHINDVYLYIDFLYVDKNNFQYKLLISDKDEYTFKIQAEYHNIQYYGKITENILKLELNEFGKITNNYFQPIEDKVLIDTINYMFDNNICFIRY